MFLIQLPLFILSETSRLQREKWRFARRANTLGPPRELQPGWDCSFLCLRFSTPTAPGRARQASQASDAPDLLSQPGWPRPGTHPAGSPNLGNRPLARAWDAAESRLLEPPAGGATPGAAEQGWPVVTCEGHPNRWPLRILPAPLQSPLTVGPGITVRQGPMT